MTKARLRIAGFVLLSLLGASCSKSDRGDASSPDARSVGSTLSELSDEQKLLLFRYAPLGATHDQVRRVVPTLSAPREEGAPGSSLNDAFAEAELLGFRTRIEFNFAGDSLYGVVFSPLVALPAVSGDSLFGGLTTFYSRHFGSPAVDETENDDPYAERVRMWPTGWGEIVVGNSLAGEQRIISWGYQPVLNLRGSTVRKRPQ